MQAQIVECVGAGAVPTRGPLDIFDASAHVVLPGLINTHHHFYQTLTRAFGPALDKELFDWLTALYPVWGRLTPDRLRLATRLAMVELLLSGCTSSVDHHYVFPDGLEDAIDIQVEEARGFGMRAVLTRGSMNLSEEDGGLPPAGVVQSADQILADSRRVVETHHRGGAGRHGPDRARPLLALFGDRGADARHGELAASWASGCTHTWPKPRTRTGSAKRPSAAGRWTIWSGSAGSATGSGWPTASTSPRTRSSPWARPAPASPIVRART